MGKARNNKTRISSSIFAIVLLATAIVSFSLGMYFNSRNSTSQQAEAAKRKLDLTDYANCESYKTDLTDTIAPALSITQPADGAFVPKKKPFDIFVKATDDKSQVYLSLYVDNQFKYPYMSFYTTDDPTVQGTYLWSVNQPNVTQTILIKACDNGGNTSWSAPIKVTTN